MRWMAVLLPPIIGLASLCTDSMAQLHIDLVSIGNTGNAPDTRYDAAGYGGVDYAYQIGRYEVSNAQYADFLNAVARTDTHQLYHNGMGGTYGGITRSGVSGSYTYSVMAGRGNMPVNYVCFWDACRFTNWLHNGQPVGLQGLATTESGAYFLDSVTYPVNEAVIRLAGARYFLPTEDEWYKAAYYDPNLGGGGYWDYATQSYTPPTAQAPPGTDMIHGSANCAHAVDDVTPVGAYTAKPSDSAYGTFDQSGNVLEWTETIPTSILTHRVVRGGSWRNATSYARAGYRGFSGAPAQADHGGFRVGAAIPEPSTLLLLVLGGMGALYSAAFRRNR